MRVIKVARELIRTVPVDTIRGVLPDIRGMLEEREFRKLAKLGQKHKIVVPELRWRRQVFMDNGRDLVFDSGLERMHSVNRNYYNWVFSWANIKALSDSTPFDTAYLNLKDTGGTIRYDTDDMITISGTDPDSRNASYGILAQAADDTMGLIIGTGSTAEDFEDYTIETLTPNGSGAGPPIEFDYTQSELHSVTNSTLTLKDTRIRDFNNNSGSSEDIEEVAEYMQVYQVAARVIMTIRDVTGGDTVADAAQYRVTLESSLVYPS
jgi:hypothetical protein